MRSYSVPTSESEPGAPPPSKWDVLSASEIEGMSAAELRRALHQAQGHYAEQDEQLRMAGEIGKILLRNEQEAQSAAEHAQVGADFGVPSKH